MVLPEAEVAHGFAYHHVPLDGQDHQGPQGNFTCKAVSCWSARHLPGPHCPSKEAALILYGRGQLGRQPGAAKVRPRGRWGLDTENRKEEAAG